MSRSAWGKPIAIYVDDDLLAQIDSYAKTTGTSRSLLVRQIVKAFLAKEAKT